MKSGIKLLFIICFALLSSCGKKDSLYELLKIEYIPYQEIKGGKWGFLDNNGNKVIDPVFDNKPSYFREGYARVLMADGYYYFINTKGEKADLKMIDATLFNDGMACIVRENSCPEYVNTELKTVFKLSDAVFAGCFSDGLAKFQDKAGKWGYVDKEGNVAIKPQFDFAGSFKEGLARVYMTQGEGSVSWIIDKQGNKAFDLSKGLLSIGYYNEGVSVYRDSTGWGVFDTKGNKVLSGKKEWEMLGDFFFGYASFLKGEKWGAINTKGEIVIDAVYENNLIFANGLAAISSNGKWGFVNIDNEQVIPAEYDMIYMPFFNETALVKKGNDILFIDKDGKQVNDGKTKYYDISLDYDELLDIDKYLQTDVFDIHLYTDTLIGAITPKTICNLGSHSNYAAVLDFIKGKGLKYVVSAQGLTVPQARAGQLTYSYIFDFDKPIGDTTSRFRSLEISAYFPKNLVRKLGLMFDAFKDMAQKAGYTTVRQDSSSYIANSEYSSIAILKVSSQLVLSFTMKGSVSPELATEKNKTSQGK